MMIKAFLFGDMDRCGLLCHGICPHTLAALVADVNKLRTTISAVAGTDSFTSLRAENAEAVAERGWIISIAEWKGRREEAA
jgi:hypothetical protein